MSGASRSFPQSAQSGHTIQDEGSSLTARSTMNFVGDGVTATDAGGKTVVTIPGGGAAVLPDNQRDIRSFGAEVDARALTGLTTSGSTITAATAMFQAGDVGKTIALFRGSFGTITRTVATYVSTTQITTSTSMTGSGTPVRGVVGTDDTAAWQAALEWACRPTGGVIRASGEGISLIAGAQVSGTVAATNPAASGASYPYSGQLLLPPFVWSGAGTLRKVEIVGDITPAMMTLPGVDIEPASTGFIIQSTICEADGGFIIDAISDPDGSQYGPTPVTAIDVRIANLTFRKPHEPSMVGGGGLNFYACASASLSNVTIDADVNGGNGSGSISPGRTSRAGTALVLPADQNAANITLRDLSVCYFGKGVEFGEHAVFDNVCIQSCGAGLAPGRLSVDGGAGAHGGQFYRVLCQRCNTILEPVGTAARAVWGEIQTESALDVYIDDPNNVLVGEIIFGGHGNTTPSFSVRGGTNPNLVIRNKEQNGTILDTRSSNRIIDTLIRASSPNAAGNVVPFGTATGSGQVWKYANALIGANGVSFPVPDAEGWAYAVCRQPAASRLVSATIKTSPTANRTWLGLLLRSQSNFNPSLYCILAKTGSLGGVYLYKSYGGQTLLGSSTATVPVANTSYDLAVAIETSAKPDALPVITVYLNGAQIFTYTMNSGEAALFPPSGLDGLYSYDSGAADDGGSRITNFASIPLG